MVEACSLFYFKTRPWHCLASRDSLASHCSPGIAMVLQDLGRRINAAVTNLTREQNLDEKVRELLGLSQCPTCRTYG